MYFSNKETLLRRIYNIGTFLAQAILPLIALFNFKIKQGVQGRAKTFSVLKKQLPTKTKTIWFHCASLGEYEQGLPVFKELRKMYAKHTIILTFFSPSGYNIRKNTNIADIVVYLPLDTPQHAKRFLNLVKPGLTVFVKYDIWPNYLLELKKRHLQSILISALIRKDQSYFKWYGGFMKQALFAFNHIFVQDQKSKICLESIHYKNVTVSGDTRFDRVFSQLSQNNTLNFIEAFKNNKLCLVAGSTWPEDEVLLSELINTSKANLKFIIAPHNIKANQIQRFRDSLKKPSVLFSKKNDKKLEDFDVFIIDTIGLLSKIYNYADIAYVGGAMGSTGLHNTLEPAVFGVPIIIGKHFDKFPEAKNMLKTGGMFTIKNAIELQNITEQLSSNPLLLQQSGNQNRSFIKKNTGAVIQITDYIRI